MLLRDTIQARLATFRLNVDSVTDADVRALAAVLDHFDAQAAADEDDTEILNELLARRAEASLADPGNRGAAAASVTTRADIDHLNRMARDRGELVQLLAGAHTNVWEDFRLGHRCSVCGMTAAETATEGYDCTREC